MCMYILYIYIYIFKNRSTVIRDAIFLLQRRGYYLVFGKKKKNGKYKRC